jgi:hypothetical protein
MDADLTSFLEGPPPCVGVSVGHHAPPLNDCRWKSTVVFSERSAMRSRCSPIRARCLTRECVVTCWHSRWRSPARDRLLGDGDAARLTTRCARCNEPISRLDRRVCRCTMPGGRSESADAPGRSRRSLRHAGPRVRVDRNREATRLEADFWEMGWRADQHFEYSLAAHRVGELANLRRDHLVASVDRRWSVVRRASLSEVAPGPISTGAPPGELREFERLGEEEATR